MFDVFIEFVSMAAFFALHSALVLGLILLGLALHRVSENHLEWQKEKAMELFYKNERR